MKNLKAKPILLPIQEEIETLARLISEKEQRTNPRLRKQMGKIRQKVLYLMESIVGSRQPKLAGAY